MIAIWIETSIKQWPNIIDLVYVIKYPFSSLHNFLDSSIAKLVRINNKAGCRELKSKL